MSHVVLTEKFSQHPPHKKSPSIDVKSRAVGDSSSIIVSFSAITRLSSTNIYQYPLRLSPS